MATNIRQNGGLVIIVVVVETVEGLRLVVLNVLITIVVLVIGIRFRYETAMPAAYQLQMVSFCPHDSTAAKVFLIGTGDWLSYRADSVTLSSS